MLSLTVFSEENGEQKAIKQAVVSFFYCFKQKKYDKAYNSFTSSLKTDIPYYKFALKARDIKKADIKSVNIYDSGKFLAKMEISVKMELIYKEKLCQAIYKGTCDVVKEEGKWKLASVRLSSEDAKVIKELNFAKEQ